MGNTIRNKVELTADNPEDIKKVIEYVTNCNIKETSIYKDILKSVSVYLSILNPNNETTSNYNKITDNELFNAIYNKVLSYFPSADWKDINVDIDLYSLELSEKEHLIKLGQKIVCNIIEYKSKHINYDMNKYGYKNIANNKILFETVWDSDLTATRTLSTMFPNVTFKHSYTDEDNFAYDCGYEIWKNGELIESYSCEERSKEAYEFSAQVMEKTLEELCYKWDEELQDYEFDWDAFESK